MVESISLDLKKSVNRMRGAVLSSWCACHQGNQDELDHIPTALNRNVLQQWIIGISVTDTKLEREIIRLVHSLLVCFFKAQSHCDLLFWLLLWIFTPSRPCHISLFLLFLSLLVNVEWQWLTVAVILLIWKGQVESSHTLIQRHITPWNSPRGTFTVVSKSPSNVDATFQFIHAISFPPSSQRGRKSLAAACCRAVDSRMLHGEDINKTAKDDWGL